MKTSHNRTYGTTSVIQKGVQFPITQAYINIRAADLMRYEAAKLFDEGKSCGAEVNMAKLYQVAPISTHMILSFVGEHILGMPRSF